jgi:hypothetical protein
MHAHGFLPFSQEADVLLFTILLRVYATIRERMSAKTIPDSGNVDWSVSSAGFCHQRLSDSASPGDMKIERTLLARHFSLLRANRVH